MSTEQIVWLASYPKSGNTWLRMVLSNYLRNGAQPIRIDELDVGVVASARAPLDAALGYDCGDLCHEEVERLRPQLYRHLAEQHACAPLYIKTHDAYTHGSGAEPLFPPEVTRAVVYIVRNPLDVCVSLSHHNGHSDHATTARDMADESYCLCGSIRSQPAQLRQRLLSWSSHVGSWLDAPGLRVHLLRYEDMHRSAAASFAAALRCAGVDVDSERLLRAIDFSCFEELRRQEQISGFRERAPLAKSFFRSGRIGTWRDTLNAAIVRQLLDQHGMVMRRLGYLDNTGAPVF